MPTKCARCGAKLRTDAERVAVTSTATLTNRPVVLIVCKPCAVAPAR